MKVFLTCTPEFPQENVNEVIEILQSVPGELNYEFSKVLSDKRFIRLNEKFENIHQIENLSFEEYFGLIDGYRDYLEDEINDEDFVVLISTIKNDKEWFSRFDGRNIFIHGDEWDQYSNVDSKFAIAHQVVENIFQSLCNIDLVNWREEPNLHLEITGCINDICQPKDPIKLKFLSATICEACEKRYKKEGVSIYVVDQIINTIELIRKQYTIANRFVRETKRDIVSVSEDGEIFIGDRHIKMAVMPRITYIYFLKNLDGIRSEDLCQNKPAFEDIYTNVKTNPDEYAIQRLCCNTISYNKKDKPEKRKRTFDTYKKRVEDAIAEVFGKAVAQLYCIHSVTFNDNKSGFKVNLQPSDVEIRLIPKKDRQKKK